MEHTFEIEGLKFKLLPLPVRAALKAEALTLEAGLPVIAALFAAGTGKVLGSSDLLQAIAGLERLEELVEIFVAKCKVDRGQDAPAWVELKPFLDLTFQRKNALLLAWLLECIEWQFADFFAGSGLNLLAERVNSLSFLAT